MLQAIVKHFGVCEIEEKGIWMALNTDYINNNYDIKTEGRVKFEKDLDYGKIGEFWVDDALSNGTVEVKTERDIWKTTGNIAVEIRCRGKLSGISATEAETWIHLLSYKNVIEGGFIFKTQLLRDKIKKLHAEGKLKLIMGGDDKMSQMALLPIKELFTNQIY